ncbi:MAG: mreD [Rhodospirillales bacterium]|jgi:rod shape-determining protein MreD|nr:mreD [Rhodospirillales bacterium]
MRAMVARRSEWSPVRLVPTVTLVILAVLTVLPLHVPDYASVAPLLALAGVYYWTIYRPDFAPPLAVFACGIVLDLLDGGPLGVGALLLLLARAAVLPQRRFFVNRLFPFVWMGFTMIAAGAILFLWLLGSGIEGAWLDLRAAMLQWVLTVATFPAVAYFLMRVQRACVPPE